MAIKINTTEVIDDDGKAVNIPALKVEHPTAASTVVEIKHGFTFGGHFSGFHVAGHPHTMAPSSSSLLDIQNYPFSISSGTATDVGSLTAARSGHGGFSSSTNGIVAGGSVYPNTVSTIEKFPFFISGGTATSAGNLSSARGHTQGTSSTSSHGYATGGYAPPGNFYSTVQTTIDKYPFASEGTATDVGDLALETRSASGQSSGTHGYTTSGTSNFPSWPQPSASFVDDIQKYPFSISSGTAKIVGDIGTSRSGVSGASSDIRGYVSGGNYGSTSGTLNISYFPFAIEVGNFQGNHTPPTLFEGAGSSSQTDGYRSGGRAVSPSTTGGDTRIDKWSFASTGNATDVGDLVPPAGYQASGHQH